MNIDNNIWNRNTLLRHAKNTLLAVPNCCIIFNAHTAKNGGRLETPLLIRTNGGVHGAARKPQHKSKFLPLYGDDRPRRYHNARMCTEEYSGNSLNVRERIRAEKTLARAKAVVSPYYGANNFAFAYAVA